MRCGPPCAGTKRFCIEERRRLSPCPHLVRQRLNLNLLGMTATWQHHAGRCRERHGAPERSRDAPGRLPPVRPRGVLIDDPRGRAWLRTARCLALVFNAGAYTHTLPIALHDAVRSVEVQ